MSALSDMEAKSRLVIILQSEMAMPLCAPIVVQSLDKWTTIATGLMAESVPDVGAGS